MPKTIGLPMDQGCLAVCSPSAQHEGTLENLRRLSLEKAYLRPLGGCEKVAKGLCLAVTSRGPNPARADLTVANDDTLSDDDTSILLAQRVLSAVIHRDTWYST